MLVGRESERRAIGAMFAGARVGDSGALVITGEPGIGKTALLAEAESLTADMRVLRAQGLEAEQLVPFAGLHQLLRPLLPLLPQLPGAQAAALRSAFLLSSAPERPPSRFAVGAATLSLVCRAAEDRPLAVLVDDGHLLDAPSAEALAFAARRLVSDAVAVVVAVRAGEPGARLWDGLPSMTLSGIDLAATAELVAATHGRLGSDRVAWLHRATGGNPLALRELPATVLDQTPAEAPVSVSERLTRSFATRLRGLDADTRLALVVAAADSSSAVAVVGACRVLGVEAPTFDEAETAGLVRTEDDRIVFLHPLVRAAAYAEADPATRRAVHRALAQVVPAHDTDRLAWHLAESTTPPDDETAARLEEVGRRATTRGAHGIAATAFARAATLSTGPADVARRLAAAGEAAWMSGATDRARRLLDRAAAAAPEPLLRARIAEVRGAVETRCGSLDAALAILLEAAPEVEPVDPATAVRLYADSVHACFYRGEPAPALGAATAIERLLTGGGRSVEDPGTTYLAATASGMAMVLNGDGARGVERVRSASTALLAPEKLPHDRFRLPLRVQGALWLRDAGPDRDAVRRTVERLREEAALGSLPYLLMHIARDEATTDRWADAEAAYLEAVRLARETGQTTDLAVSLAGLAVLHARRGRAEECLVEAEEAEALAARSRVRLARYWSLFARGDLAAGRGDLADARACYLRLETELDAHGFADPDQSCAAELVETEVHLDRLLDASQVADRFAEQAAAKGQPWSCARAERALALCSSGPAATRHFETALALHAQTADRFETARTRLAYGAALRRDRQRVAARPVLRSALAAFESLGAQPWADRAAQELRATGETVQPRTAGAVAALTPQERQVASLLAAGRTTRETAAALFLSPKTVEYHLRHVYQKLEIRSRAELAERLSG